MDTQLVRNTISLSDLNDAKTRMDDKLKESINNIIYEFENNTKVAVSSVTVDPDKVDSLNRIEVTTKLDIPL